MRNIPLFKFSRIAGFLLLSSTAPLWLHAQTVPGLRVTGAPAGSSAVALSSASTATAESLVPGRLVVVYRSGTVPVNADQIATLSGVRVVAHLRLFGVSAVQANGDMDAAMASLRGRPEVANVLHDRYVKAHSLTVLPVPSRVSAAGATPGLSVVSIAAPPPFPVLPAPIARPILPPETDSYYESAQGWAVQAAGGYGRGLDGGPSAGPWSTTLGKGVRIAILDSGVDATHPDIAPNLTLNLSEIDQSALPSACDDGSPRDQTGHGTFTASLAAGALGPGTGLVAGVAPQASLLNIKVMQRMAASAGATPTAQCEAGSANGLLSWVLQGIQDAVANHADTISLSLGTLVDVTTGDGAGWQAQMDSVTYAAMQAGAVLVAATGNDGLDLSTGRYVELPAQARGVLPVVASTNPACAEDLAPHAACVAGPVTRAYYSNFGPSLSAIAAPGGSLPEGGDFAVSGFVRGACSNGLPGTGDGLPATGGSFGCFGLGHVAYVQAMGTSAAAPLVAGAAALLRAAKPGWTPQQIVAALLSSATTRGQMVEPSLNLPAALALQ